MLPWELPWKPSGNTSHQMEMTAYQALNPWHMECQRPLCFHLPSLLPRLSNPLHAFDISHIDLFQKLYYSRIRNYSWMCLWVSYHQDMDPSGYVHVTRHFSRIQMWLFSREEGRISSIPESIEISSLVKYTRRPLTGSSYMQLFPEEILPQYNLISKVKIVFYKAYLSKGESTAFKDLF